MAVDVVLTKHIQEAIVEALQSNYLPHDLEKQLSQYTGECLDKDESNSTEKKISVIPFKLVKRLWECHSEHVGAADLPSKLYLHELLTGSEIYVEPLRLPEKSPELIARLNKLKAEQEQAEYNRMITNVDRKWNQSDGMHLGQEIRSGRKQLASIVNFLLSVVATFAFGYVASQYAFPSEAVRVLIGLSMAFAVAIAELYFMARVEI
ncbi:transmembrane protein 199-like isoform X1 [Acropora millepora]|uniref:transmembrane protein 199-like isoform X1 n=1 Tax=Acropora millepora TaxID=45264 RepID=UPI0010FCB15E|nr:transmembrane protein 199-like isoform X1 [Acropora millepora]